MSINPIRKSKSKYNHQKQSTKSGNEDNSPEEEELKKYRELIEKLSFIHQKKKSKDKSAYLSSDSVMETNNINISSNIRRTTSRTKEILNDRDFLLNFMNYESMPILPKNMHLLTDNDTNQNIDEQTKFKNLSDLLLDDKESVIESDFIKKTEEKMILKLYTALSRRSKDIFMEENDNNFKKNKNRILFHKINNIEIPHFKILDKDDINNNEININNDNNNVEPIFNNLIKKNKKSKTPQKESNYDIINNININPDINYNTLRRYSNMNIITELNKDKLQFNSDCLYNKKNNTEKIIKIPTLIRKGYLLAGVVMAANMFVVNEVKAMKDENKKEEKKDTDSPDLIKDNTEENNVQTEQKIEIENSFYIGPCKYIGFLLQWENTINLVGGALFTFANGLYNFYEDKPSFYFDGLFAGWNSIPFARGYLQFCPNINLGRGIFWLVIYYAQTSLMRTFRTIIKENLVGKEVRENFASFFADHYLSCLFGEYTPFFIANKLVKNMKGNNEKKYKNYDFIKSLLRIVQNFVSVPLIIHLTSRFSISIAFDSIMWMVVTHFVINDKSKKTMKKWKNSKTLNLPRRIKKNE